MDGLERRADRTGFWTDFWTGFWVKRYWLEGLVLAAGIGLYAFQLGQESLWIDEMLSIGSARGPLDLNRPLYFVLLRVWLRVGEGEVWLRSLSVLFGLACLGLTYWLGRRLVSRRVGLAAGLLFALSPLAINHAQEVRFYMMSACLGVAGSLCLSYALQRPGAVALGGWIVCRCLGFLTAQPNLLLVVPDLVLVGGLLARRGEESWLSVEWADPPRPAGTPPKRRFTLRGFTLGGGCRGLTLGGDPRVSSHRRERRFRRWGWALGLLVVPTAIILKDVVGPLIEFLFNQKWYAGAARPPSVTNLVGLLAALTAWPLAGPEALGAFYQPLFKLYAGLILAGSLLPVVYKKLRSAQIVWVALWGFLPIVLVFLLAQFFPFLWLERYAVISIPYVAILLAVSWVWLWERRKRMAIALAAVYLVALSGPLLRYYTTDYRADWRGLAEEIQLSAKTGDVVAIYPGSFLPYINYYYKGSAELVPIDHIESYTDVEAESLADEVQRLSSGDRLWLVCPIQDQWEAAKDAVVEELAASGFALEKTSARVNHWNWGPVLYLFEGEPS